MVLPWFSQGKAASVDELIARKKYAKAIEAIRAAIRKRRNDSRLRLRLADVLVLSGQKKEAAALLNAIADDVALAGNAAQAIALLKRVEALEPGRADVEEKLAYYIRHRSRPESGRWARPAPEPAAALEFGIEEITDEPGELEAATSPESGPPEAPEPGGPGGSRHRVSATDPAGPRAAAAAQARPTPPERIQLQPLKRPAAPAPEQALRAELEALLEDALGPLDESDIPPPAPGGAAATPLFRDFTQEELVEVIRGLALERFEAGEIVVTEGEPGDSLFVIAAGSVRAWIRASSGRSVQVRALDEGDFFGEISLLTGEARSATVTTASPCELLVLDRATVDRICEEHPRVLEVLREFRSQRADNTLEAMIRQLGAS